MRVFLTLLKWAFWLVASLLAGLVLLLTLAGKGVSDAADLLMSLLYCAVAASPGLLIHLAQKRL
jgi:hypothetical protein